MSLNQIRTSYPPLLRQRYFSCRLCEANKQIKAEIKFDQGTVEPAEDEILTGASSGDKGTVEEVELLSGSWAGGDAAGYITMTSPSGIDSDGHWGTDNEAVTGNAGAAVVLDGEGTHKIYGLLYPEGDMVFADGAYYCRWHHAFRFIPKRRDENKIHINEER